MTLKERLDLLTELAGTQKSPRIFNLADDLHLKLKIIAAAKDLPMSTLASLAIERLINDMEQEGLLDEGA